MTVTIRHELWKRQTQGGVRTRDSLGVRDEASPMVVDTKASVGLQKNVLHKSEFVLLLILVINYHELD